MCTSPGMKTVPGVESSIEKVVNDTVITTRGVRRALDLSGGQLRKL